MLKESALINKLNKQITMQFNNYTRLLGQTYACATEAYSGGASLEVTRLFYLWDAYNIQYPVYLNAATASYLCVLEWAGTSPSANHASPKATFAQLDWSIHYSATFARGRGKWTLPATLQWHTVHQCDFRFDLFFSFSCSFWNIFLVLVSF